MNMSNLLRENMFRPQDVEGFQNKLFFEGARSRPYLERFSGLLFLATLIAGAGVLADSTATVIGAMIVAPLMTPIMATAAALVMGQMNRAIKSSLLVAVGVAGVIITSMFLAWLFLAAGSIISFETNSQILGRISPRLIDLIAALASGAAGAFCMSRDDIADSLPGVAISISLVPPLCVVGIAISSGEWDAAYGALLLFVTNFLSILLAGGGVLALLGLGQAATKGLTGNARRNAFIAITIGVLAVTAPLAATGIKIRREAALQLTTRTVVTAWLADTEFDIRGIRVSGNMVDVLITGPGESPLSTELVAQLSGALDRPVELNLEIVPSQKEKLVIQ
jgi:uncharacterized hydrophobic protein (TIGR00271 family)